jgi:hypothetical protein
LICLDKYEGEEADMSIQGKGFFIWRVPNTEGGNPKAIADLAVASGMAHIVIKIADGAYSYNVEKTSGKDLALAVVQALHDRNIEVWGWHYVYGNDPLGEARKAIQRVNELNLEGYVIDAEEEYKKPGKDAAARTYMTALRSAMPTLPIALCSYRFPSYHPNFPWKAFLEKCDLNMPQVYWVEAHNPASQLDRCIREFKAMTPFRPILPTGIACNEGGWSPTESDVTQFLSSTRTLNLAGANFWDWEESRSQLPKVFGAIANFKWPGSTSQVQDICQQLIDALNTHDVNKVAALYEPKAVHINATRTVQGIDAIKSWYTDLFQKVLPDAHFILTGSSGEGASRHFTWHAASSRGPVNDGSDTLGLVGGDSIAYHYASFTPPAAT